MRSKAKHPPQKVTSAIEKYLPSAYGAPDEAWCAAHLAMLCSHAIDAYANYGVFSSEGRPQRGLLLNYESLPASLPLILLNLFGVEVEAAWTLAIENEARYYSKGRGKVHSFDGDSEDKDSRASNTLKEWANKILLSLYEEMEILGVGGARNINSELLDKLPASSDGQGKEWSKLEFPEITGDESAEPRGTHMLKKIQGTCRSSSDTYGNAHDRHSRFQEPGAEADDQFFAWDPFASTHSSQPFERIKCPDYPPKGYPNTYPIMDLIENWNPDDTNIPARHYDSLCHFDMSLESDRIKAENYREAEMPFIVFNHPEADAVVERWGDIEYLRKKIGNQAFRTETSTSNHFMYWSGAKNKRAKNWHPPTGTISVKFDDWLDLAVEMQNKSMEEREHQYFRVTADSEGTLS